MGKTHQGQTPHLIWHFTHTRGSPYHQRAGVTSTSQNLHGCGADVAHTCTSQHSTLPHVTLPSHLHGGCTDVPQLLHRLLAHVLQLAHVVVDRRDIHLARSARAASRDDKTLRDRVPHVELRQAGENSRCDKIGGACFGEIPEFKNRSAKWSGSEVRTLTPRIQRRRGGVALSQSGGRALRHRLAGSLT